jgi:hypothetical protein
MADVLRILWSALTGLFRSRARLEPEILVLRQQINVLRRKSPKRFVFSNFDRLVLVGLYRLIPGTVDALAIVRPETVICWHRAGFRSFWRWKSRRRGGRPKVPLEIRRLIRGMSLGNPLWGAPRIHGELLELGIDVARRALRSTWPRGGEGRHRTGGPFFAIMPTASPRWVFVVPTVSFGLLHGFLVLRHGRRRIMWLGVTANPEPTALVRLP